MHIWELISCHAHTCIYLKRNFHAIYLHFERQFHIIYSFWEAFLCHIQTCVHSLKRLTTYSIYTRFIWRVFVSSYLFYIYMYMYMVNNIFTQTRQTSWCSPKNQPLAKGKSLSQRLRFYAFLHSKPKAWIPRSMSLIWALILAPTSCPNTQKQQPYMHKSNPQAKIHKPMRKCH